MLTIWTTLKACRGSRNLMRKIWLLPAKTTLNNLHRRNSQKLCFNKQNRQQINQMRDKWVDRSRSQNQGQDPEKHNMNEKRRKKVTPFWKVPRTVTCLSLWLAKAVISRASEKKEMTRDRTCPHQKKSRFRVTKMISMMMGRSVRKSKIIAKLADLEISNSPNYLNRKKERSPLKGSRKKQTMKKMSYQPQLHNTTCFTTRYQIKIIALHKRIMKLNRLKTTCRKILSAFQCTRVQFKKWDKRLQSLKLTEQLNLVAQPRPQPRRRKWIANCIWIWANWRQEITVRQQKWFKSSQKSSERLTLTTYKSEEPSKRLNLSEQNWSMGKSRMQEIDRLARLRKLKIW